MVEVIVDMVSDKSFKYSSVTLISIDNKKTSKGIIIKNQEGRFTINCSNIYDFNIGEEVFINISNRENGKFVYQGIISYLYKNTVMINRVKLLEIKQDRKKIRVVVNFQLEVEKIRNEEDKIISLTKPILMLGKDLSVRGILLQSPLDIPEEVNFIIQLHLDPVIIEVETTTRRKYKNDKCFYYGCEFVMLKGEEKEILESFIKRNINSKFHKYYGK